MSAQKILFLVILLSVSAVGSYFAINSFKEQVNPATEVAPPNCLGIDVAANHYAGMDMLKLLVFNSCKDDVVIEKMYAFMNGSRIIDLSRYQFEELLPKEAGSPATLPLTLKPSENKYIRTLFPAPPYANLGGILVEAWFKETGERTKLFFPIRPSKTHYSYDPSSDLVVGAVYSNIMPATREAPNVLADEITLLLYYVGKDKMYVKDVYEETTCGIVRASEYFTSPLGGCLPFSVDGGYTNAYKVLVVDLPLKRDCHIKTPDNPLKSIHVVLERPGKGEIVVEPTFVPPNILGIIRERGLGYTMNAYYDGLKLTCGYSSVLIDIPQLTKAALKFAELSGDKVDVIVEFKGFLPSFSVEEVLVISLLNGYVPIEIPVNKILEGFELHIPLDKEIADNIVAVVVIFKNKYSVIAINTNISFMK